MDVGDFPASFWESQRSDVSPPTEERSPEPYRQKGVLDYQRRAIPAFELLRKQSYTQCQYFKPPRKVLIEANGCEVWEVLRRCWRITEVSQFIPREGKWTVIDRLSEEILPAKWERVVVCPGKKVGPVTTPAETWTVPPTRDLDPGDVARERMGTNVLEGGEGFQIRVDIYWKLQYPIVQIDECTVDATYVRVKRTQKFTMPDEKPVDEPTEVPFDSPAQTMVVRYKVPDCPKPSGQGGVSLPLSEQTAAPVATWATLVLVLALALLGLLIGLAAGHRNESGTPAPGDAVRTTQEPPETITVAGPYDFSTEGRTVVTSASGLTPITGPARWEAHGGEATLDLPSFDLFKGSITGDHMDVANDQGGHIVGTIREGNKHQKFPGTFNIAGRTLNFTVALTLSSPPTKLMTTTQGPLLADTIQTHVRLEPTTPTGQGGRGVELAELLAGLGLAVGGAASYRILIRQPDPRAR